MLIDAQRLHLSLYFGSTSECQNCHTNAQRCVSVFCPKVHPWEIFFHKEERFPRTLLLNKVKIHEVVKVKGKLVAKRETIGYLDPADMSRCKPICTV